MERSQVWKKVAAAVVSLWLRLFSLHVWPPPPHPSIRPGPCRRIRYTTAHLLQLAASPLVAPTVAFPATQSPSPISNPCSRLGTTPGEVHNRSPGDAQPAGHRHTRTGLLPHGDRSPVGGGVMV